MTIIEALNSLIGVVSGIAGSYTDKTAALGRLFTIVNGTTPSITGETDYEIKGLEIDFLGQSGWGVGQLYAESKLGEVTTGSAGEITGIYGSDENVFIAQARGEGHMAYNATEPTWTLVALMHSASNTYPQTLTALVQVPGGDSWDTIGSINLSQSSVTQGKQYLASNASISYRTGKSYADIVAAATVRFVVTIN